MIMLHKEDTLVDRPGRGDQTLNKWNVVTMESSITRALIKMDMTTTILFIFFTNIRTMNTKISSTIKQNTQMERTQTYPGQGTVTTSLAVLLVLIVMGLGTGTHGILRIKPASTSVLETLVVRGTAAFKMIMVSIIITAKGSLYFIIFFI